MSKLLMFACCVLTQAKLEKVMLHTLWSFLPSGRDKRRNVSFLCVGLEPDSVQTWTFGTYGLVYIEQSNHCPLCCMLDFICGDDKSTAAAAVFSNSALKD